MDGNESENENESHIAELPSLARYMVFGNRTGIDGIGYGINGILYTGGVEETLIDAGWFHIVGRHQRCRE